MIATSGTKQIALLRSVPPGWRSQAWLSWSSHWCRDRRRCSATPYTTCPTCPPACWCSSGSGPPAGPRRRAIPTALNGPKTRWDRCRRGHLGQRRGRRHRKCRQARPPRHHAASGLGHCRRRRGGDPRQSAGGPLQTCGWSQDPIGHDDRRRQTLLARRAVLGGGRLGLVGVAVGWSWADAVAPAFSSHRSTRNRRSPTSASRSSHWSVATLDTGRRPCGHPGDAKFRDQHRQNLPR